ncbi:MAG: class I SAM-dependent methyltransferase [Candidatus Omnitrophica bacterium]|nr:methyltransferase domain-containing protein [Candidatus Omnitrophota bacterium]MBU3934035.1 class I SAM-dependent methyltransferase [Candidatus Omnitrophota bacterium]
MYPTIANLYGFETIKDWHYVLSFEGISVMGSPQACLAMEPRIDNLRGKVSLNGKSVLELGCLEGVHSSMLQAWGAKKVVAIEGKRENFLKSLIVKNAYKLDKCEFLYGDVNTVLDSLSAHFDLCLALGILYHVSNPVSLIFRIGEHADSLFVWTHYADEKCPKGPIEKITQNGLAFSGKYMHEDTTNILGSLEERVFWLFEDDLFRLVRKAGFNNIELIEKEDHEHGPAMTFLAKKDEGRQSKD